MAGSNMGESRGSYGTIGIESQSSSPGARQEAVSWTDRDGKLWLFGGYGYSSSDGPVFLNDLWKWNGTTWIWVSGSSSGNSPGAYGTIGAPTSSNFPGARRRGASWVDKDGELWLFGGNGFGSTSDIANLNDLWKLQTKTE
jgi:N-acetylneuraminic acid mutarotase